MKAKTLAVFLLLSTTLSQAVIAAPYGPGMYRGPSPDKAVSTSPGAIVKDGISKLQRFIKSGRAQNREQALAFMATEIEPYFDFEYMTRWAAGPAWRRMSPQQRARVQRELKQSFMETLADKLVTYSDQPIRYFTPRGQESNDVRVSVWIMQPSGIPTRLEFRFYRSESGWKVFDVKAEGNSAVIYYRNQFRSMFYPERESRY
ncbi:MAG: ABC transporter substrate-binding protein [Gammaproteobacteria bacterium]